jgi:hypothetical protein
VKQILFILVLVVATTLDAAAQQWDCSWITHPAASDTTQVWFRRTYTSNRLPQEAFVSVASTGYFTLYVNGRNVSTDILMPLRKPADTTPRSMTFCVTRFLRRGKNTIAVWYSPACRHADARQLSVCYYGNDSDGEPFAHRSDASWLCREANMTLTTDGGETQDATLYNKKWNINNFDLACWLPAKEAEGNDDEYVATDPWQQHATQTTNVMSARYFDITDEGVLYDFAPGFYGFVRVTLRNCKRGEHISINGLQYTCNGEQDEQAFGRFAPSFCRKVLISGDENFDKEQVQNVEAISIAP